MKIKLNEEIIEYCKILKLKGIRTHFEGVMEEATDYEDFLHKLLTYEMEEKDKRSIDCRIRNAHLPYRQYFEDIEMDCLPADMQRKLPELATLDFIEKGKNIIMTGNPGTGKTMCKWQVLFHKKRQIIFHKIWQLKFHTYQDHFRLCKFHFVCGFMENSA